MLDSAFFYKVSRLSDLMASTPRAPPGPPGSVTSDHLGREERMKTESRPGPRQVEVECVAPYKEATWIPIGREQPVASVQYSQGLRPPGHLTSFIRIGSQASKGITNSADNAMVFVVMRGELTVTLNSSSFMATRGDTVYIPPHNNFNLLNTGSDEAELFNFQYKWEQPKQRV